MLVALWLAVLVLAAGLVYMFWLNRSLRQPEAQTKLAQEASQQMINDVGKLILLPSEQPTVATITDADKLRQSNATFYKDAKNGDTLLVYPTQAIIYRSNDHKIIAVSPIIVTPSSSNTTSNSTKPTNEARNQPQSNATNATP